MVGIWFEPGEIIVNINIQRNLEELQYLGMLGVTCPLEP